MSRVSHWAEMSLRLSEKETHLSMEASRMFNNYRTYEPPPRGRVDKRFPSRRTSRMFFELKSSLPSFETLQKSLHPAEEQHIFPSVKRDKRSDMLEKLGEAVEARLALVTVRSILLGSNPSYRQTETTERWVHLVVSLHPLCLQIFQPTTKWGVGNGKKLF